MSAELLAQFPALATLAPAARRLLAESARRVELPAGARAFSS